MKNHPVKSWEKFKGMNATDPSDRIDDEELAFLLNAVCDKSGRIQSWQGMYPVTMADDLGLTDLTGKRKVHIAARFRGKTTQQRGVAVVGSTFMRTGPNNVYQNWSEITFPADIAAPALDRVASIAFRNRYCYHQNGVDIPFRVQMENDDLTAPDLEAEVMGLKPPIHGCMINISTATAGTTFPPNSITEYAVTFVYGDRGESAPSPVTVFSVYSPLTYQDAPLYNIPLGGTGVTARRIYRTKIGTGSWPGYSPELQRQLAYAPQKAELFFLTELPDNTTTTYTDGVSAAGITVDQLDFSHRCPPMRPFPMRSYYQTIHQDKFVWANLREHPWVFAIQGDPVLGAGGTVITVDNTGNGTITIVITGGAAAGTCTVSNYKTKTLRQIWKLITVSPRYDMAGFIGAVAAGQGAICIVAPGVDWDRSYRFRAVTSKTITTDAQAIWLEAIDDATDTVVVDGCERFPNRGMWSNVLHPEEINPLNFVDISRHDVYPITGLFRDDYTVGVCTENDIWTLTGTLAADPETWKPEFTISRTQSEHGSFCTRPDAIVQMPDGVIFVAKDGLRLYRGQNSTPWGHEVKDILMKRLLVEPRARDNVSLCYENGIFYVAFPGEQVA